MVRLVAFLEFSSLGIACLSCAAPGAPPVPEVRFPVLPRSWSAVLGEAAWSLRWTENDGTHRRLDGATDGAALELRTGAASAVLAYPYWPGRGIGPGMARPAGAIHPFDEEGGVVFLEWRGGPPAVFFRELAGAGGPTRTSPELFDWPRFRELLYGDLVAAEVAGDPWVVDWRSFAEKTRSSGFDRRRLVPRSTESVDLVVPVDGPWVPSSPFASPPPWTAGERATIEASEETDSLLCAAGILRYSRSAVIWLPMP